MNVRRFWLSICWSWAMAAVLCVSWSLMYPHAPSWQLLVAGIIGSLCGQGIAGLHAEAVDKDATARLTTSHTPDQEPTGPGPRSPE